jgi:Protein of unknown function (DUF2523)
MFALFVPALVGALAAAMGTFAGRALIALGVGFVTYKGIDVSVGMMKDSVLGGVRGLPADALNLVGYLWIDKALTVIISAISAAMTMKAIGGSVKKAVFK